MLGTLWKGLGRGGSEGVDIFGSSLEVVVNVFLVFMLICFFVCTSPG